MNSFLMALISPVTGLVSGVIDYFAGKVARGHELNLASHDRKMAAEQRLKELALDKSAKDSLWALEQIRRSDTWLRRISFILVWTPLIAGAFFPTETKEYFDNVLSAVPEWYVAIFVGMMMAVFGLKELHRFRDK
jgi:hypothetical protein